MSLVKFALTATVVLGVVAILMHHGSMKRGLEDVRCSDLDQIRQSAEFSIISSSTVSPVLSLVSNVKAIAIIESLHTRYGPNQAAALSGIDTSQMLETLKEQHLAILNHINDVSPGLLPSHPLANHSKILPVSE